MNPNGVDSKNFLCHYNTHLNPMESKGLRKEIINIVDLSVTIYQMKAKPHGNYRLQEFLQKRFVAIGWPGIADLTNVDKEEIRVRLERKYGYTGQQLGYNLGAVNSFVNGMSEGDIILIRDGDYVHIGILGPYEYVKELDNDNDGMCHQRPTDWVVSVNRRDLNAEVQSFVSNRNSVSKFPHPTAAAELEKYLTDFALSIPTITSTNQHQTKQSLSSDDLKEAQDVLRQALKSNDESLRVQAAIALLNYASQS